MLEELIDEDKDDIFICKLKKLNYIIRENHEPQLIKKKKKKMKHWILRWCELRDQLLFFLSPFQ